MRIKFERQFNQWLWLEGKRIFDLKAKRPFASLGSFAQLATQEFVVFLAGEIA
jgi:hypothetical protein